MSHPPDEPAAQIASPDRVDRRVWIIAAACMLGPLMSGLDASMANVSLNAIGRDLGVPIGTVQWVTSGYLLALALALPLTGWLVDRIGARRMFLGCFAWFLVCSALSGVARSAPQLIAFRALQGIAGGLLAPMMQMMMARHAGRQMARVIGIAAMPVMVGQMLGPSLGGLILTWADWHWIFMVNVPIGLIAMAFAWIVLPADEATSPRRLDVLGFLLISPGLALLLEGLVALAHGDAHAVISLAVSAALLAAYVVYARRNPATALIDLALFEGPVFRAAASTQFFSNAISFGGQFVLPLYFLSARGLSPGIAGLMMAPMAFGVFLALPSMGRLSERFGARAISSTGALLALVATLPFALGGNSVPLALAIPLLVVRGFGCGSITLPSAAAAYASVPREQLGQAVTAINICQRMGGPSGTTALAICLQLALAGAGATERGYVITFWVLVAINIVALMAALRLPGRRHA